MTTPMQDVSCALSEDSAAGNGQCVTTETSRITAEIDFHHQSSQLSQHHCTSATTHHPQCHGICNFAPRAIPMCASPNSARTAIREDDEEQRRQVDSGFGCDHQTITEAELFCCISTIQPNLVGQMRWPDPTEMYQLVCQRGWEDTDTGCQFRELDFQGLGIMTAGRSAISLHMTDIAIAFALSHTSAAKFDGRMFVTLDQRVIAPPVTTANWSHDPDEHIVTRKISRWFDKACEIQATAWIFICHTGANHWLSIQIDPATLDITIYDSLGPETWSSLPLQIQNLVNTFIAIVRLRHPLLTAGMVAPGGSLRQHNMYDCALYALMNALGPQMWIPRLTSIVEVRKWLTWKALLLQTRVRRMMRRINGNARANDNSSAPPDTDLSMNRPRLPDGNADDAVTDPDAESTTGLRN